MEYIIDIIVTETTNLIEITSQPTDEIIDVNIIDNRENITLNVTPTVVEININSLTGNFGVNWGEIGGTLSSQTDLNTVLGLKADLVGGKVPSSQLPSYVDDVVEVANYAALPATGETGKIYITLDTNYIYRWSGTVYVQILDSAAVWGAITGSLSSQSDLVTALSGKFNNPTGDTTQYIAGDGSLITFPVAGQAGTLVREVRNTTGATLTKGTIVYISGATGNKPTVSKALATGDSTSAQTFGMLQADLANNTNGYVVCVGNITGLDTSALTEGVQLYLSSTTAGTYTTTKQVAPAHLVYIGVVTRSHPTLGQIEVKIQNGYELDEIHDVLITSKANNDGLFYESSTSLWKNKSIATVLGYTPANGANYLPLTGGTLSGALTLGTTTGDNQTLLNLPANNQLIYRENVGSLYGFNIETIVDNSLFLTNTEGSFYQTLYFGDSTGSYNIFGISTSNNSGSTWNPRLVINQNGNIGLNKNNPTEILDVAGNGLFSGNVTANSFIKSGGTSSQFLKADGSIDSTAYVSGSGTTNYLPRWSSSKVLTDSFVYTNGNYTEIQGQGLTAFMGIVVAGRYGSVANAPKIYSSDETTGVAHIEFVNGGGEIRLGVEKSTGGQILPGSSAYATVLTAGLSGRNLEFGTNNTKRMTISGSTGAVTITSTITTTGATFTGALSGTSATFSGAIITNTNLGLTINPSSGTSYQAYQINGTNYLYIGVAGNTDGIITGAATGDAVFRSVSGKLLFSANNGASANLTIASTGAATFSSSVTAVTSGANSGFNTGALIAKSNGNNFRYTQIGYDNTSNYGWIQALEQGTAYTNLILNGAGGNVGIGTTSPANYTNYITQTINGANGAIVQLQSSGTPSLRLIGEGVDSYLDNVSTGALIFRTTSSSSERMRITSSGNVGIGTTAPFSQGSGATTMELAGNTYGQFFVSANSASIRGVVMARASTLNDVYIASITNSPLLFGTNDAERMRITIGGNVLVGTTTDSGWKLDVNGWGRFTPAAATSVPTIMLNQGGAYANIAGAGDMYHGIILRGVPAASSDYSVTAGDQMSFYEYGGVFNFYKKQPGVLTRQAYIDNGNVYASAYFETSDATIKNLIQDNYQAKGIESIIAKLYIKNGKEELGYYAQDVQEILPSAVSKGTDGLLSLSYREVLVAKVQFLEQKVKELEAKLS